MEAKDLDKIVRNKVDEVKRLVNRTIPVKVGNLAVRHFKANFRKGGFVDNGLHKWKPAKRIGGTDAGSNYGTLTFGRNHPMNSTQYIPGIGAVRVFNDVPYALIHNTGGTTHPTVTPQMRKYFWAMFFKTLGIKPGSGVKLPELLPPEAEKYKAMALTKKTTLTVNLPKRQFIGESAELTARIKTTIEKEIQKLAD